jgi:uncharacterized phage protein gp47/JayE
MATLNDLLTASTEDEILDVFLALLAAANLPVTSWHVGGVARTIARLVARGLVSVSTLITAITKGGFNSHSFGDWLTLLSSEVYANTRQPATFAQGQVQLALSSAIAGPYTIAVGQLWFVWNGKRYRNTSGDTLTWPATVILSIKAESPGAAYNAPDGQMALQTPLAGMVVQASTISVQGTDAERDAALQARNKGKWGTLGATANDDGFDTWAREASVEVTRVLVQENTPVDGEVRVVVAGAAGAIGGGTLATINAYLETKRALCVPCEAISATAQAFAVTGTVRILSSHPNSANALAQAVDALNALLAEVPIGGTVRLSDLYGAIEAIEGVDSVLLSAPASDTTLGATSVPSPSITLTPVYV